MGVTLQIRVLPCRDYRDQNVVASASKKNPVVLKKSLTFPFAVVEETTESTLPGDAEEVDARIRSAYLIDAVEHGEGR